MITNLQELNDLLVSKGIKPTYPRLRILKYVQDSRNHPTADMIYQEVVAKIPTISKTTVYNTLKAFAEQGIVVPVTITGTEVRFDHRSDSHHHFMCEKCGAIIDLEICCPNLMKNEIHGHQVRELHGYFKGVCAACREKK